MRRRRASKERQQSGRLMLRATCRPDPSPWFCMSITSADPRQRLEISGETGNLCSLHVFKSLEIKGSRPTPPPPTPAPSLPPSGLTRSSAGVLSPRRPAAAERISADDIEGLSPVKPSSIHQGNAPPPPPPLHFAESDRPKPRVPRSC